jgi:hypothetical protein
VAPKTAPRAVKGWCTKGAELWEFENMHWCEKPPLLEASMSPNLAYTSC